MTARRADLSRSRGRLADQSFHFLVSLCRGPRISERRDVHQIVSDAPGADPAMHAVDAMVATAAQSMATFEHTDAAFAPDAPALATAEPMLALISTSRGRLGAAAGQDQHPGTGLAVPPCQNGKHLN